MSTYGRTHLIAILGTLVLTSHLMRSQQTTNTNCNVNGNAINCTSTATDNGAQQQRSYEAGQQIGNALGNGLAGAMQAHSFSKGLKKYCDAHPGEEWHYGNKVDGRVLSSGRCPTDEDKGLIAANEFMAHHKDYIRCPANSQLMVAYLETHKLDPREQKSYERGYKDLKKDGQLQLYAK